MQNIIKLSSINKFTINSNNIKLFTEFIIGEKIISKINSDVINVENDWFKVANAPLLSNFFLTIKIGRYELVLNIIVLHLV